MADFQTSLNLSGLGEAFDSSPYVKWGKFTQEAADLVIKVHLFEKVSCPLISVTWLNESVFNIRPVPNTNGNDANWFGYDIGPAQLNLGWSLRMAWQGELKRTNDLLFVDVFGKPPYLPGQEFTGNPLANLRVMARRLLAGSLSTDERTLAVRYTGPKAQSYRGQSYDKFAPLFKNFFDYYLRKG